MTHTRWAMIGVLVATTVAAQGMPDLVLDQTVLGQNVRTEVQSFAPGACELQAEDLCLGGAGSRKLLRFDVLATNAGDADLVMGQPNDTDRLPSGDRKWIFSSCHGHWHFKTFARYELRRAGTVVLEGQKRSFCIEDTRPAPGADPTRRYCCREGCTQPGIQGIQAGWGDLYSSTLPCQWIDVTDLEPGDYELCVLLNTERQMPDADASNDVGCVPITIDAPSATEPAPRVVLRSPKGRKSRRAGKHLTIAWQTRIKGGRKSVRAQDVFVSLDGGATFELVAGGLASSVHKWKWTPAEGTSVAQALVRVVAWSRAGHRGAAESKPFVIAP